MSGLYLLSWCPGKSPPDKCDVCVCNWYYSYNVEGESEHTEGNINRSSTTYFNVKRGLISICQPCFAVEFWQVLTAENDPTFYWAAGYPSIGFPASISISYQFRDATGAVKIAPLASASVSVVLDPLGNRQIISNAPQNFIRAGSGSNIYGFVYGGPLSNDDPQTFIISIATDGQLFGYPGYVVFNCTPAAGSYHL